MKVLVTGGAGFIGSFVSETLLAAGHQVWVVDNLSSGRLDQVPPAATFIHGDVREPDRWEGGVPPMDAVIHLAAQISVAVSEELPDLDADINVVGTVRMLMAAHRLGAREFRFASSAAVYGALDTLPLTETMETRPISFYGINKLAAEQAIFHYAPAHEMAAVVLRLANVYGPRQRTEGEGGVVAVFAETAARGQIPVIHGDGRQTRDFVAVQDIARAFAWRLGEGGIEGAINISNEVPTAVMTVWQFIAGHAGLDPAAVRFGPPRAGDIRHSLLSNAKAMAWGFLPELPLAEGLRDTYGYFNRKGTR